MSTYLRPARCSGHHWSSQQHMHYWLPCTHRHYTHADQCTVNLYSSNKSLQGQWTVELTETRMTIQWKREISSSSHGWRFLHVGVHQCCYPSVISCLVDSFLFQRGMPLSSVLYILFGHPMRPCSCSVFFITLSNVGGCNSFHMRNSHCVSFAGQTFGHLSKNWFHQPLPVNFFAASAPLFLSTVCRTILITGHLVLGQLISVCYYR